jgi:alanyl-tRNA synthetase
MGLERCAAVLQGVDTNYHIDILRPLVETAAEILKCNYNPANDNGRRLRRIADHIRACTFAVHENVYPGNKEEKYVIRRLLRRAVLDGRQLGWDGTFLHLLVPKVAELMKLPYPELAETTERVAKVIEAEEQHFIGTVDSGLEKIERIFDEMEKKKRKQVNGVEIFDMYQTFGFPPELFETIAAEHHFTFDWSGFKREMEHHGELSGSKEKNLLFKNDPLEGIKKTQHRSAFWGYGQLELNSSTVVAILADGKPVDQEDKINNSTPIQIILDNTTFYGEKGGQVGDKGWLLGDGIRFEVVSTQIDGELIVHFGHLHEGIIRIGDKLFAKVDKENRQAIARAHSATHLLHYVLRRKLGGHAEQQGSKVDNDLLRFDFTNHQAVDRKTLHNIEEEVNQLILAAAEVICHELPIDDARKTGAMMLFGEKYPELVRVVQIGDSKELCGGTHLTNSSQIGFFKIIAEESVSAGTRRITALTGKKAMEKVLADSAILQQITTTLKIPAEEIPAKIELLTGQVKKLQKQLQSNSDNKISVDELIAEAEIIANNKLGNIKVITQNIPNSDVKLLRQLIDQIRQKTESVAVLFSSVQNDKITLVAGLSRDLVMKGLNAENWVKTVTPIIGGKGGGGRPDFAQSGGTDPTKLQEAFDNAKLLIVNSGTLVAECVAGEN